jgi:imidazolonepropionase-like amidohydrolase
MEFLEEAGLTPAEVLVAATYGGALALGMEDEIGTVEAGKLADMVVLRANPLMNVRNARQIEWVIKGGVVFAPSELLTGP